MQWSEHNSVYFTVFWATGVMNSDTRPIKTTQKVCVTPGESRGV